MGIELKDVKHVAKLARLGLSSEEEATFKDQLSAILDYAEKLNEAQTEDISPTSHVTGLKNVFREDKVINWPHTEDIVNLAPQGEKDMFKVPKILG